MLAEGLTVESENTGAGGFTVRDSAAVSVEPVTFDALNTGLRDCSVVGVPVIAPVDVLKFRPVGNELEAIE